MPKPPTKSSAYAEYLYLKIDEYFIKQGSAFTVQEIADFAGLKPTTNMRRRIRHAVAEGKLYLSTAYSGHSTRGFLYMLPPAPDAGDIPF